MRRILVLVLTFLLFFAAAARANPVGDLIDRILGRASTVEIESILNNPHDYSNKTVTVKGIFGTRGYFGWVRGDLWGIKDQKGNILTVEVNRSSEMYGSEFYEYIDSLYGKMVEATGRVDTTFIDSGFRNTGPLLVVEVEDLEMIE